MNNNEIRSFIAGYASGMDKTAKAHFQRDGESDEAAWMRNRIPNKLAYGLMYGGLGGIGAGLGGVAGATSMVAAVGGATALQGLRVSEKHPVLGPTITGSKLRGALSANDRLAGASRALTWRRGVILNSGWPKDEVAKKLAAIDITLAEIVKVDKKYKKKDEEKAGLVAAQSKKACMPKVAENPAESDDQNIADIQIPPYAPTPFPWGDIGRQALLAGAVGGVFGGVYGAIYQLVMRHKEQKDKKKKDQQ